jgi:Kef-type K+ transport system membrane component KefB
MENVWVLAAIWVGLALIATLLAIWLKISTALTEIVVGTVAQLVIGAVAGSVSLGAKSDWVSFLAGTGAIVLTFLAGAELDPGIFRSKWKEAGVVGLVGFFAPFLGCSALAYYLLHWTLRGSLLAGVALSTTSVAVVYAVMLELGFNTTEFGKAFKYQAREGTYYTLMMSTGLTFGTISALFGLSHGIISDAQYSYLVATVIASAVIPTMVANEFFLPKHFALSETA